MQYICTNRHRKSIEMILPEIELQTNSKKYFKRFYQFASKETFRLNSTELKIYALKLFLFTVILRHICVIFAFR